jgi:rod shape-determining protein MreB
MLGWNVDLGLDVGTSTTRIYQRGVGVVLAEPTSVVFSSDGRELIAVGTEAKLMMDQDSEEARGVFPARHGVIADHIATAQMVKEMIRQALGRRTLFMPRIVAAITTAATPVERAALRSAVQSAGARSVRLAGRTLAAAIGGGTASPQDHGFRLIVSIGGGITEYGVVAHGRLVWGRNLRFGGRDLDEAIRKMMRNRYGVTLAPATAEQMKIQVGAVVSNLARSRVLLGGGEVYGDLFRNLKITLDGIPELLSRALSPVINEIGWALAEAPAEQRAEIKSNGILLAGGTAQLQGLPELIRERIGVPVVRAREPGHAVALGLGTILQDVSKLSRDGNRYG